MNKKKVSIIIVVIILLLFAAFAGYLLLKSESDVDDLENKEITAQEASTNTTDKTEEESFIPHKFTYYSSTEGLVSTDTAAKTWASDAKLYSCSGITVSSYQIDDHIYEYVGNENGNYTSWLCDFYSQSKGATMIVIYKNGESELSEVVEIGQYSAGMYNNIDYPSDVSKIVATSSLYSVLEDQMDKSNYYYNMYLADTSDYGYVWKVEETSKTEMDEYNQNVVTRTFVFNPYTGELTNTLEGSIY